MSLSSTPPLSVSKVITTASIVGGTVSKLTLILPAPYQAPLFLAVVIISQSTTGRFSSSLTPGTNATHGGKLYLYVDAATFAVLLAQGVVPFKVVLSYDTNTNDVVQIELVRDVAAVNQDLVAALVIALQQALPNGERQAMLAEGEAPRRSHPSAE